MSFFRPSRRRSHPALFIVGMGLVLCAAAAGAGSILVGHAQSPMIGGCPIFPADNIWNTPVTNLPVDANSNAYINSIGANTGMHPDFGAGQWQGAPIGIPYIVVPQGQAKVPVSFTYASESDPGPYPIPANAPIEGGASSTGDRHVLVVEQGTCKLYETWSSYPQGGGTSWQAGSGALFDLTSNNLRSDTWTSADAAGLPILPGLVRHDEVAAGVINHALRFTVVHTRNTYVWPARHQASSSTNAAYPPMGQRFRLKASFNISGYSHDTQVILTALKTYGMIIADNGSNWYLSGAPDPGWDDNALVTELGGIKGLNFEAVNENSLQISANSGQAAVPPAAPSALNAAPISTSKIDLNWTDNAVNESGFYIERKTGLNGTYATIAIAPANSVLYHDTNLTDNTTYYYQIRAFNSYGFSATLGPASAVTPLAVPLAPSNLSVWAISPTQVKMLWADNSHNESGFAIERSPDGTTGWTQIGPLTPPDTTSGADSSLTASTTYFYRIKAHNTAGDAYSNVAKVITTLWLVTNAMDDGHGGNSNMLSYALANAVAGQSINFNVGGGTISFVPGSTWTPAVPNGVNIIGSCDGTQPLLTINGTGLPAGTGGLVLNHNVLYGVKIVKFPGGLNKPQLSAPAPTGNRLLCVVVTK